jgi:GNAT superfamily N-acetyltransferase
MIHNTILPSGLDRSLPHIGVIMEKSDTNSYPRYNLPVDYHFSYYQRGFEQQWAQLQFEVEQVDSLDEAYQAFHTEYLYGKNMNWIHKETELHDISKIESAPYYEQLCKQVIFVVDSKGKVVGTGSVWNGNMFGKELKRLHWVAVSPMDQGKGIAKAIVTRLLDIYNTLDDCGYIYLTSQTWSYRAINVYFQFGFTPYLGEKPEKWISVNLTSGNYEPWDYNEKNMEAWKLINDKIMQYKALS